MQRLDLTVFKALISPCVDYQICFSRILQQDPIFCCRKEGSSTEKCNQRPCAVPQSVDSKNNEKIQHNYGRPDSWTAKLQHYTRVSMELIRV